MIRRVNVTAGPGIGKSTAAAWLFSKLKMMSFNVDLVQERVKEWVYEGKKVTGFDQLFLFAEQLRREELLLKNGVDIVVTDSPVRLAITYARRDQLSFCEQMLSIAECYDVAYPPMNIVLVRQESMNYVQHGRYENPDQAKNVDDMIVDDFKKLTQQPCFLVDAHDNEKMLKIVLDEIKKERT